MIVTVRFHDISYAEFRSRHAIVHCTEELWNSVRGKPVMIIAEPLWLDCLTAKDRVMAEQCGCKGPYYKIVNQKLVVCSHSVEIGD